MKKQSHSISQNASEFHALKIKLLKEEHQAKILLIERQREMGEEEHKLRMDILRKCYENITNVNQNSGEQVPNFSTLNNLGQLITYEDNICHFTPLQLFNP